MSIVKKSLSLVDLLNIIKDYAPKDKEMITRAYEYAKFAHRGQFRKSGEPYITHPIAVACILAEMHADVDTICAGLLHDVIEDGKNEKGEKITKEDLAEAFNPTVAKLVDGVTKLPKFSINNDKSETDAYNTRKILESFTDDIRILIIKLADRLHNMRTMEYQKPEKQVENSKETMAIFVPFAHKIGAYTIKHELEDLAFKYIDPKNYALMQECINNAHIKNYDVIESTICKLSQMIYSNNVQADIKFHMRNLHGLYRKLSRHNQNLSEIHDLVSITVLFNDIESCYRFRDQVVNDDSFITMPNRAKDYIQNPKLNEYRSLHTTLLAPNYQMIQLKMHTPKMEAVNNYGITAVWDILKFDHAPEHMQEYIQKMPFYKDILELAQANLPNKEFNKAVEEDVLSEETVYLKTPMGEQIELPIGATPVDFAYKIHEDLGNGIIAAKVNGEWVPLDFELRQNDVVEILFNNNIQGPIVDTFNMCVTNRAKKKIKAFQESCRRF